MLVQTGAPHGCSVWDQVSPSWEDRNTGQGVVRGEELLKVRKCKVKTTIESTIANENYDSQAVIRGALKAMVVS